MKIIVIEANEFGARPSLQDWPKETPPEGYAFCPDEFVEVFYSTTPAGFVNAEFDGDPLQVVSMEVNQEALDAYLEENKPDLEVLKSEKEAEISNAAHNAIVEGVDIALSDGSTGHFSLEETDQINLTTAYNAVLQGAVGYPYHADGQLCKVYPAADILAISEAATAHKLYHTTYCNHVLAWVRRTEDPAELETIVYGAELPEDLAANMAEVMTNAAMV